jgi:hypothetical protein
MEGHVEGLVELVVLLEVGPVGQPGHEDQMSGRRDRQQLGRPLHQAEHERLPVRERAADLSDPECGQDERDDDRRAGRREDADPAPHRRRSYHREGDQGVNLRPKGYPQVWTTGGLM